MEKKFFQKFCIGIFQSFIFSVGGENFSSLERFSSLSTNQFRHTRFKLDALFPLVSIPPTGEDGFKN